MLFPIKKFSQLSVLAVALAYPAPSFTADRGGVFTGTVVRLAGHARHSVDSRTWQETRLGDTFGLGSVFVQTDSSSSRESLAEIMVSRKAENLGPTSKAAFCTLRILSTSLLQIADCRINKNGTNEVTQMSLDLRIGDLVLVVLHHSSNCEARLDKAEFSRLSISSRPSSEAGQSVLVFRPAREIVVFSGSIRLGGPGVGEKSLKAGDRLTIASGEITELPPNAPERRLWP